MHAARAAQRVGVGAPGCGVAARGWARAGGGTAGERAAGVLALTGCVSEIEVQEGRLRLRAGAFDVDEGRKDLLRRGGVMG